MNYPDFLQTNHNCTYKKFSMHASTICSILQPKEQTRVSKVTIIRQLLKGVLRKKLPTRVLGEIWDVIKIIDLLLSWSKPANLKNTRLTLMMVMILALATIKRPSDLNLLRITSIAMQLTAEICYLPSSVWGKESLVQSSI